MDSEWKVNKSRFLDKLDVTDCNFCTTDPNTLSFKKENNIFFIPNPVDISFEKLHNYRKEHFNNDVFFAMSHGVHRGILKKGKYDKRESFMDSLIMKTPDVRFDLYGMENKQPVWADNFINAISQSKMGINLSQGKPVKYYSSDRLAQLVGNGLLVLVDKKTQFTDFFTDKELIFYKNIDDLSEKILKYSRDNIERSKIAKKGRDKYFKYFNSTLVAEYIINKTFGLKKKYFWDK